MLLTVFCNKLFSCSECGTIPVLERGLWVAFAPYASMVAHWTSSGRDQATSSVPREYRTAFQAPATSYPAATGELVAPTMRADSSAYAPRVTAVSEEEGCGVAWSGRDSTGVGGRRIFNGPMEWNLKNIYGSSIFQNLFAFLCSLHSK